MVVVQLVLESCANTSRHLWECCGWYCRTRRAPEVILCYSHLGGGSLVFCESSGIKPLVSDSPWTYWLVWAARLVVWSYSPVFLVFFWHRHVEHLRLCVRSLCISSGRLVVSLGYLSSFKSVEQLVHLRKRYVDCSCLFVFVGSTLCCCVSCHLQGTVATGT